MGNKKLVKFSENDWHYKLIRFVWGIDPSIFRNLCPYFWLMIASVFVFLPVLVYKGLKLIFKKAGEYNDRAFENGLSEEELYYVYQSIEDAFSWNEARILTRNKRYKYLKEHFNHYSADSFLQRFGLTKDRVMKYKKSFDTTYNKLVKDYEVECENKKVKERKAVKQARKREDIAKRVSNVTKQVANVLFGIGIIVLGGILCILLTNLFCWGFAKTTDASVVGWILLTILGGLALCVIGVVLATIEEEEYKPQTILGYLWYIPLMTVYLPIKFVCYHVVYKFLYYVGYVFLINIVLVGIAKGFMECLTEFGGIFGEYLGSSYSDYCPGINWKEKEEEK